MRPEKHRGKYPPGYKRVRNVEPLKSFVIWHCQKGSLYHFEFSRTIAMWLAVQYWNKVSGKLVIENLTSAGLFPYILQGLLRSFSLQGCFIKIGIETHQDKPILICSGKLVCIIKIEMVQGH